MYACMHIVSHAFYPLTIIIYPCIAVLAQAELFEFIPTRSGCPVVKADTAMEQYAEQQWVPHKT